jgi:hypothetical protein
MPDRLTSHYDPVDVVLRAYGAGPSLSFNTPGDNTAYTPPAGKSILLQYLCLSADGANNAPVLVAVKFTGSSVFFKMSLVPGAIWARNIGAGKRCLRGLVDEALIVNLDVAQMVHVSHEHEDF